MDLKPLTIGNLTAIIPVIQGGMGVGISLSGLAGAVAKEGGIGVISAAQPGFLDEDFEKKPLEANLKALEYHIKRAKEISNGGIIGVNIMCALSHYDEFVKCSVESGADIIISGAGLPLSLPALLKGTGVKCVPIVSSSKAARLLLGRWDKREQLTCDMVVIEGPAAGGHLGFSNEDLSNPSTYENYDEEVTVIISYVKEFEEKYNKKIPVIFAGGVYCREDAEHYMELGCSGVQMSTRFVGTYECDADEAYKMAYVNAKPEDIVITKSPVGMPGRAINNNFINLYSVQKEKIKKCYRCLVRCNPDETPYCITGGLTRAAKGDVENSLLFCGINAAKVDKIVSVKEIMDEFR